MRPEYFVMDAMGNFGLPGSFDVAPQDVEGNRITRTKQSHPYSFDEYVSWVKPKYRGKTKNMDMVVPEDKTKAVSYSDRLNQWDAEKFQAAFDKHLKPVHGMANARPHQFEAFLADYHDDPELELVKVVESCNHASGYPLWAFAYIYSTPEQRAGKAE